MIYNGKIDLNYNIMFTILYLLSFVLFSNLVFAGSTVRKIKILSVMNMGNTADQTGCLGDNPDELNIEVRSHFA